MKLRPLTRWSALAAVLAVVILIGFALSRSRLAIASDGIPLAQVKHGDLDLKVHADGELNATHTMMLTAPAVGGGALRDHSTAGWPFAGKEGRRGDRVRSQRTALQAGAEPLGIIAGRAGDHQGKGRRCGA